LIRPVIRRSCDQKTPVSDQRWILQNEQK
jgi:hypothetical protein